MITASVKTTKKKAIGIISVVLAFIIAAILFFSGGKEQETSKEALSRHVTDNESRRDFISSFGWETEKEPSSVAEVLIPSKFDAVLEDYNKIQLAGGMDLTPFLGKTVMKYSYPLKNYEGGEAFATIYVYDGSVIAADISSHTDNTQYSIDCK